MHLSCANGVAVVSNEIKTNGGTTQDGDREGKRGRGAEGKGRGGESVIALGMCRLSGVRSAAAAATGRDATRLDLAVV